MGNDKNKEEALLVYELKPEEMYVMKFLAEKEQELKRQLQLAMNESQAFLGKIIADNRLPTGIMWDFDNEFKTMKEVKKE